MYAFLLDSIQIMGLKNTVAEEKLLTHLTIQIITRKGGDSVHRGSCLNRALQDAYNLLASSRPNTGRVNSCVPHYI